MRFFRVLQATLLLLSAFSFARPALAEPLDFVFDLDDTLIRWIRDNETPRGQLMNALTDGKPYRYQSLDGAAEILLAAAAHGGGSRVSVFSFGPRDRNLAVLSQLKLPDGRSALELIQQSGGKVLSLEDKTSVHGENQKDLTKINPDLSRVVIFEDNPAGVLADQRDKAIFIGRKAKRMPFDLSETKQADIFIRLRNRLALGWGVFKKSEELAQDQGIPLSKALQEVQSKADLTDVRFYRAGAQEFHALNPEYRFTTALDGISPKECIRDLISEHLQPPSNNPRFQKRTDPLN